MKILYYSPHPNLSLATPSGPGTHMREVIEALEAEGHTVIRFIAGGEEAWDVKRIKALNPWYKKWLRSVIPVMFWQTLKDWQLLRFDKRNRKRLDLLIRKHHPDLIYERGYYLMTSGVEMASRHSIAHLMEMNAPYPEEKIDFEGRSAFLARAERAEHIQFANTHGVFVVSSALQSHFAAKYPHHSHKLQVTSNAINLARAHANPELRDKLLRQLDLEDVDFTIGFVGSIFRYHGVDRLLKDFARLVDTRRELSFRMIIVGDGAVLDDLRLQSKELGIEALVTFCGNVPHADVYTYIDLMDIAVMARSNWYGSPVKVFEYGAMNKAIIAPDNVPLRDVMINGEDGILVGTGEHEVYEAMRRLIDGKELMVQLAESFHRKVVKDHTWSKVAARILQAGSRVIDERLPLPGYGLEWKKKVLAVRTNFRHHGNNSGYKQILKYVRPAWVIGIVEGDNAIYSRLKLKYQWLFERDIRNYLPDVDLIHIMYAEDYLRFATKLYPEIPVVATFHQPAETLMIEVSSGATRGRLGQITHWLSRSRFRKLAAAIVTEESQKQVLSGVMDENKIYVIPLGVHLSQYHAMFHDLIDRNEEPAETRIITVGNWLRDWPFYFEVLKRCEFEKPEWKFDLVNRKLPSDISGKLQELSNLRIHKNLDDTLLKQLLFEARCHFLPVTAASGNNALMEGLAMGCPAVMTDVVSEKFPLISESLKLHKRGDVDDAIRLIEGYCTLDKDSSVALKRNTFARSLPYDWAEIARQTMEVYKRVTK